MPDEILVRHCSPTLAGIKTGNIFTYEFKDPIELRDTIRKWNRLLQGKGVRMLLLRYQNGRALIYLYRPARLSKDLGQYRTEKSAKYCRV